MLVLLLVIIPNGLCYFCYWWSYPTIYVTVATYDHTKLFMLLWLLMIIPNCSCYSCYWWPYPTVYVTLAADDHIQLFMLLFLLMIISNCSCFFCYWWSHPSFHVSLATDDHTQLIWKILDQGKTLYMDICNNCKNPMTWYMDDEVEIYIHVKLLWQVNTPYLFWKSNRSWVPRTEKLKS